MTDANPFKQRPSLISRIFCWIYGTNDFRENNFVLLEGHHRPNSECWHAGAAPFRHTSHIYKQDPNISDLFALGNYLSDRMEWMFETIGKLNVTQAEIANESILKLDLINHTVEQICREIPEHFGDAFQQMYVDTFKEKDPYERVHEKITQLETEIKNISLRIEAISVALGVNPVST